MSVNRLKEVLAVRKLNTQVWCRLAPSNIHGIGIFAIKNIPKGTDPFGDSFMGDEFCLVPKNKLKTLPKELTDLLEDY